MATTDFATRNQTLARMLPDSAFECVTRSEEPIEDDALEIRAIRSAAYGPWFSIGG
jgi:hypothetical protein